MVQAMFPLNIYLFQAVGLRKSRGYVEENRTPGKSFIQRCVLITYFVLNRHGLCFQAAHREWIRQQISQKVCKINFR